MTNINLIKKADLPVHCPNNLFENSTNTHPKIFLCFDEKGQSSCPYCAEKYQIEELYN